VKRRPALRPGAADQRGLIIQYHNVINLSDA
jgi:hypothetical protein